MDMLLLFLLSRYIIKVLFLHVCTMYVYVYSVPVNKCTCVCVKVGVWEKRRGRKGEGGEGEREGTTEGGGEKEKGESQPKVDVGCLLLFSTLLSGVASLAGHGAYQPDSVHCLASKPPGSTHPLLSAGITGMYSHAQVFKGVLGIWT